MEATPKQIQFIKTLTSERVLDEAQLAWAQAEVSKFLTKQRASAIIDRLLKLPKSAPASRAKVNPRLVEVAAKVPAGSYAIIDVDRTEFVEVDKPTRGRWAGRVFVTRLTGENHEPVRNEDAKIAVLEAIAADVEGAVRRYGRLRQECGFCHMNLTDQFSRFFGVGPVCRRNHGMAISEAAFRREQTPVAVSQLDRFIAEDQDIEQVGEAIASGEIAVDDPITAAEAEVLAL